MLRKHPPVDPVLSCLSCFRKPSVGVCQVVSNSPDPGIAWPSARFRPDLWRWFEEDPLTNSFGRMHKTHFFFLNLSTWRRKFYSDPIWNYGVNFSFEDSRPQKRSMRRMRRRTLVAIGISSLSKDFKKWPSSAAQWQADSTHCERMISVSLTVNCVLPPPHVIFLYYFLFSLSLPLSITRLTWFFLYIIIIINRTSRIMTAVVTRESTQKITTYRAWQQLCWWNRLCKLLLDHQDRPPTMDWFHIACVNTLVYCPCEHSSHDCPHWQDWLHICHLG